MTGAVTVRCRLSDPEYGGWRIAHESFGVKGRPEHTWRVWLGRISFHLSVESRA